VAGDKDIQILKAERDICCQDSKSATPRKHQVPDMCQHLEHGLTAESAMTVS